VVQQWIERVRRELEATGELEAARSRVNGGDAHGDVTGRESGGEE
jgi:hypothetical protein